MFRNWRKILSQAATGTCLCLVATNALADFDRSHAHGNNPGHVKNAIIMIPDGCSESIQTLARWYKGADLNVDGMQPGIVKTHMANSVITGSAAAGTAFATGHKTTVRFIGVGPRQEDLLTGFEPTAAPYAPVASVLEAAQRAGKSTGIISTSRVTHATPAAYASHIHDRGLDNEIMEHIVYNNVDVVFGGGMRHLLPRGEIYTTSFGEEWSGYRTDSENLLEVLQERGYQIVDHKDDLMNISSGKVWGMFNGSHMQPELDRERFAENEPSLAEMTAKAIEILSQNPKGFLLMVEGSQVDWAGHNNDPAYMVTDFLAFDDAVGVASDFAANQGQTLVLAFPDHNTGGMTLGHYTQAVGYTETTIEDLIEPLRNMRATANGVVAMMHDSSDFSLAESVREYWNIDLSDEELAEIRVMEPQVGLSYALARVVSRNHTVVGWTTHGHTGETVPLWMTGMQAPQRVIDNTELALLTAQATGLDLEVTTHALYVDLGEITHDYSIDTTSDPLNPMVKIGTAALPINKDFMIQDGQTIPLPGLTILAPMTGKVYLSQQAVEQLGLADRKGPRRFKAHPVFN